MILLRNAYLICAMTLLFIPVLKGQSNYKYCFSRDTVEIFAKSNLKRLEVEEKYNLSLRQIDSLDYSIELYQYKDSVSDKIIDRKIVQNKELQIRTQSQDKIIKRKDKLARFYQIAIGVAFILGLLI